MSGRMVSRILVLACSATKRKDPGLTPAWSRYDGPTWRTMRANIPPTFGTNNVFTLSAEHGLISAWRDIRDYDRRMTVERARELYDQAREKLGEIVGDKQRTAEDLDCELELEIFTVGGQLYRRVICDAINNVELDCDQKIVATFARGGIGEQLGQLKQWLRREA